jgi:hypothetical protein
LNERGAERERRSEGRGEAVRGVELGGGLRMAMEGAEGGRDMKTREA